MAFGLVDCTVPGFKPKQVPGSRLQHILSKVQIPGLGQHDTITLVNKQDSPTGHDIQAEFLCGLKPIKEGV